MVKASTLRIVGIDTNLFFNFQEVYLAQSIAIPPPTPNTVSKSSKLSISLSIISFSTLSTKIIFSGVLVRFFFKTSQGIFIVNTIYFPISLSIPFEELSPILSSFTFVFKLK